MEIIQSSFQIYFNVMQNAVIVSFMTPQNHDNNNDEAKKISNTKIIQQNRLAVDSATVNITMNRNTPLWSITFTFTYC